MEIIHIILGKANPDRLNGVNKVVHNLATEQSKAGKSVQVWGITSDMTHNYPERNFETRLFKASKNPFSVDQRLKQAILEHPMSVFHLHGGWIPVFASLARLMVRHRIKYVLTPHGAYNTIAMQKSALTKKLYLKLFEAYLLKNAAKVHAIGGSEVEGLQKVFPKSRSFLLPYGFEASQKRFQTEKQPKFTIGFMGRLDTYTKGLDLLLEAFSFFQKTHADSELWIVGEGPGRKYLEDFISKNQLSNVVLWGKRFGEEKDLLMAKMHVFAHPSRNEGLPSAVLEAAALGIPVIVTQATNLATYVQEFGAGIGIEDENLAALLEAMYTLYAAYAAGKEKSFGIGARNMLSDTFAWPVLVERYDELYA